MKDEMKYALVTGSSRSIGEAIALRLAKDGFSIFVHCRKEESKAESVRKEIESFGMRAHVLVGDLTKDNEMQRIFSEISKITKSLDVLVNNVGFDYGYLFEDYTREQIVYMINVNLIQKMMMTKYALPFLKKSRNASIVNISSRMGKEKTIDTISAYGPAEAGIIKFTQCCALEFRNYKIRVNCVAPGLTRTDLTESIFADEKTWETFAKANPSGRVGKPEDIANAISFLVSDDASYINGETLGVNGGSNLG
ncbi:SDR family oxidoreductase [Patescibacteria group bacterium]|nr:SDR family oxidoreductase [Patescibacteria group bacterium]